MKVKCLLDELKQKILLDKLNQWAYSIKLSLLAIFEKIWTEFLYSRVEKIKIPYSKVFVLRS